MKHNYCWFPINLAYEKKNHYLMHFCCDKIPDLGGLGTCHPLVEVIIQPQTHLAARIVTKCTKINDLS